MDRKRLHLGKNWRAQRFRHTDGLNMRRGIKMVDYLPIGTIVLLKNTKKRLMIYGRKETHLESQQVFDYIGCLFPEGYIDDDFVFFFNQDQIGEVMHLGLNDPEDDVFISEYLIVDNVSAFK